MKVAQLMKADQQLWLLASDEGLPSLKPAADGVKPLNPVVEKLRVDRHHAPSSFAHSCGQREHGCGAENQENK